MLSKFHWVWLLSLHFCALAWPVVFDSPDCPNALAMLASHYQKATLQPRSADPIYRWALEDGADASRFYDYAVRDLEPRIITLIEDHLPEYRGPAIARLATETGLSPSQIQSFIDYYSVVIYETPELAGPRTAVWDRLEDLRRAVRLTEPAPGSRESRYLQYLFSITNESVPQIAERRGVSEGSVRADLSILRLSIVAEFERNGLLDRARQLLRQSPPITIETVARSWASARKLFAMFCTMRTN